MKKKITNSAELIIILLVCIGVVLPNGVYASLFESQEVRAKREITVQFEKVEDKYMGIDSSGKVHFDVNKARDDNVANDIVRIGELVNLYSTAVETGVVPKEAKVNGIPIWGNWCGPGYGHGEPVDVLDEGCRRHDNCYNHKTKNCACNRTLIQYIDQYVSRMSYSEYLMAVAISAYFTYENFRDGC